VYWVPRVHAVSAPVEFVTNVTVISSFVENEKLVEKVAVLPSPEYVTLFVSLETVMAQNSLNTIYSMYS
jgi:hypothetical protein